MTRPTPLVTSLLILILCSASLRAKPAVRKATVYPPPHMSIVFDHRAHKGSECKMCHGEVEKSTRAGDTHSPSMEVCATCHATSPTTPLQACGSCHVAYPTTVAHQVQHAAQWRAVRPAPMVLRRPQARLHFSHKAHALKGLGCQHCHGAPGTFATPVMPSMAQCTSCHTASNTAAAAGACSSCHTAPMPTLEAAPMPMPVKASATPTLAPQDHTVDWVARHGVIAKASATACFSCHTPPSCAQCHDASAGNILKAHPPNYIVSHRISAVGNSDTCTSCHVLQKDCLQCHAQSRLTPSSAPRKLEYHPPGWVEALGAGGHGQAAKQNIQNCVSCHQERDCVSCHQGISPHPDTFATRCSSLLAANPLPCATCHTDLASLRSRCF